MDLPSELSDAVLDPRDVKPGMTGVIFLISRVAGSSLFEARFLRVRTIKNNVNVADMQGVVSYAGHLSALKIPYCAFSAGRDTPLPGSNLDADELAAEVVGRKFKLN